MPTTVLLVASAVALCVLFLAQNALFLTTNALIYVYETLSACQLYASLCLLYGSLRFFLERRRIAFPHLFACVFAPAVLYSGAVLAGANFNALTIATSCVCIGAVFASVIMLARAFLQKSTPTQTAASAPTIFSAREREVVTLILQGKTTQETADVLCISVATVKTHLQHIYEKAGVRNRAELARFMNESHPF